MVFLALFGCDVIKTIEVKLGKIEVEKALFPGMTWLVGFELVVIGSQVALTE